MARVIGGKAGLVAGVAGLAAVLLLALPVDLSVSVTPPGGLAVGSPADFGVGIGGAGGATGLTVTAIFLPKVTFSASVPAGLCTANTSGTEPSTTVTCNATGLSSLTLRVVPQTAGTLTVIVGVIANQPDSSMLNNSARATVTVGGGSTPVPTPVTPVPTPTGITALPTATNTPASRARDRRRPAAAMISSAP
jgi:hypothetical protein